MALLASATAVNRKRNLHWNFNTWEKEIVVAAVTQRWGGFRHCGG